MITSYNDMPLGKYIQVMAELQRPEREEIDRLVTLISILGDMPEEDVLKLPIDRFSAMAQETVFLYGDKPQYTGRVTDRVILDGRKFHITAGVNELTAAQYIDFQTFAKDPQKYIVELLSVFIIPEGKKYNDGYDILDTQRVIRDNLTVPHATAIAGFFLRSLQTSVRHTLIFLAWKMAWRKQKNMKALKTIQDLQTHLTSAGDGLRQLIS